MLCRVKCSVISFVGAQLAESEKEGIKRKLVSDLSFKLHIELSFLVSVTFRWTQGSFNFTAKLSDRITVQLKVTPPY